MWVRSFKVIRNILSQVIFSFLFFTFIFHLSLCSLNWSHQTSQLTKNSCISCYCLLHLLNVNVSLITTFSLRFPIYLTLCYYFPPLFHYPFPSSSPPPHIPRVLLKLWTPDLCIFLLEFLHQIPRNSCFTVFCTGAATTSRSPISPENSIYAHHQPFQKTRPLLLQQTLFREKLGIFQQIAR